MKKTYYYYTPPEEGERRITVAGVLEGEKLNIGVAACSTKDAFVKAKGRNIAEQRALKGEGGSVILGKNPNIGLAFRAIAVGVAASMMSNKYVFWNH